MNEDDLIDSMQTSAGMTGLFSIVVTLLAIIFSWMLIQEFKWESLFRNPRSPKARMLQVVLSVIIGYLLARFVLDYWGWSSLLKGFVE
ncbi:DUF1146 family protein [Paenibacillus protaetiae]|uniref:DUF1146 domain-containing protein n=1 Tax=Paenibacillus protaetiae TaxID=2509456 RepID=A0A4V0YFH4_9BACL|nr:DUF1146 family protein [Paenibacillus protaetiae]QAY67721.1 DUF1146 domain-containing protein [Paenibacillus protaetiae]